MKKKIVGFIVVSVFVVSVSSWAQQVPANQSEKDIVIVSGHASKMVNVDAFRLDFVFDVDRGSFGAAVAASEDIVSKIEGKLKEIQGDSYRVIKGWDLLKQKKISVNSKSRKISNKISIDVDQVKLGELLSQIGRIVDAVIQVNSKISLESMKVYVSDYKRQRIQKELVAQAVGDMQALAAITATKSDRKIKQLIRVVYLPGNLELEQHDGYPFREPFRASTINVWASFSERKSFNVEAEVSDQIEMSTRIMGYYEMD
ncbi:MAG: SIMPL domain-containing protein [Candidatus Omnitrophica bacterium]|nr:SIMPL domain-containing protein [Candidatus Omnitrophota bacterium]